MRKVLTTLGVLLSLGLMVGEAQSSHYTIRQNSYYWKVVGCGYNPQGCVYCTKTSGKCFIVDGCDGTWCNVWGAQRNPPKIGPGQVTITDKSNPLSGGSPLNPNPVSVTGNPGHTTSTKGR